MLPQYITLHKNSKDIAGQHFGRLIVLGPTQYRHHKLMWLCSCSCGNMTEVAASDLCTRNTKSCGCLNAEKILSRKKSDKITEHPLYRTWSNIKTRCMNSRNQAYHRYGECGIDICDEWKDSFLIFCEYVSKLENYRAKGFSLDRIDNEQGYQPGNLKWSTAIEQARNRRDNRVISYSGKAQTIAAWAEEIGIKYQTLWRRLHSGWTTERALSKL